MIKEIKIHPSGWTLDVIVSKNKKQINECCKKRYGIDNYFESRNECSTVDTDKNSIAKGEKRVVILVESLSNKRIIIHELIHALWHIAKCIGYEMNYESQEWQAVLYEYLYAEIIDKKNYTKIN